MITKHFQPESFQFDVPSVELIGVGSKGLDKTAMHKRASVFDDVLDKIDKKANRTYLHVITTGAHEKYGPNLNGDTFNENSCVLKPPYPENDKCASIQLDGGLLKYHDKTYMEDGAVYQEHQTKKAGVDPSGEIVIARYNPDMHRGELIIAVDTNKWAPRLQKKASGQNIYLSMGCSVAHDTCSICGRQAKTASQHCDHFKKHRNQLYEPGVRACVYNDAPHFYDISGVDVPADRIAFVLQKVASGVNTPDAYQQAYDYVGVRTPILYTKAASVLHKLSKMEKEIEGMVDSVSPDIEALKDAEEDEDAFIAKVKSYPSDEVIDATRRKGILLSPRMLFKLMSLDSDDLKDSVLSCCDDSSCGDMSCMMQELEDSDECNSILQDGSFDQTLPVDLRLDSILDEFMPLFSVKTPDIHRKVIIVSIRGNDVKPQEKKAALNTDAQEALRRTYARYMISFASQNDDFTCRNALMKSAAYGK